MSQPNNQVFVGFSLEVAGEGDVFTLDDSTKGVLNNTTFTLADDNALVDISGDVRSIRTRRGRSRELDKFSAGQIDVLLSNRNRKYDPTNARQTGTRQNLIPNPSFEAAMTNWNTGASFFTISPTTRTNLVTNPSFEVSTANWTTDATELTDAGASVSRVSTLAYAGSFSAEVSTTTSTQGLSITLTGLLPSTTYTISAYLYPEYGDKARLLARDVINNVSATPSSFATAQAWTRVSTTLTTGAGSGFVLDTDQLNTGELGGDGISVVVALVGEEAGVSSFTLDSATDGVLDSDLLAPNAGAVFYVDAVMVEQTSTLQEYFDGTYRDSGLNDATSAWNGTTGLSTSTLTWANVPTISRDGSLARFGASSGEVELFTRYAGQGIWTNVTGLAANTTYTVSCYAYVSAGSAVKMSTRDTTNSINGTTSSTTSAAAWTRIDSQITTGASTATVLVAVYTDANYLVSGAGPYSVFYVDAFLFEAAGAVDYYFDGNTADPNILLPVTSWAGTANNSISNLTYSIPDTGSPYYPDIVPRKRVTFTSNDLPVFDGVIDDWAFSYEIIGDATAQIVGSDAFSVLSVTNIEPHSASQQLSSARVSAILSRPEVDWPAAKRNISTGQATVAAQDIGGTGANARAVPTLNYLQQVEQAEAGALFINKSGFVEFDARTGSQGVPTVKFSDDGTGIPFIDLRIEYGTTEMRNRVSIYREGANTQVTAEDLTSIATYGAFDYEINNSLLVDDTSTTDLATYIVSKYANPRLRIDQITVVLNELSNGQVNQVLGLELADGVQVVYTPERVGDPIDQVLVIDSIEHNVTATTHLVTLNFSESSIGFLLDDATHGVLNTSELGF